VTLDLKNASGCSRRAVEEIDHLVVTRPDEPGGPDDLATGAIKGKVSSDPPSRPRTRTCAPPAAEGAR
jgi:hypothetical protein